MAEGASITELARLVSELRSVAERLRATASALAAARTSGLEADVREVARSALEEIDRARRRGKDRAR